MVHKKKGKEKGKKKRKEKKGSHKEKICQGILIQITSTQRKLFPMSIILEAYLLAHAISFCPVGGVGCE
jgi:hypothetical protein